MIQISFLEFLIRGIPEGLLFFLALYAFSKKTIDIERYLFSSIVYSISIYIIKFLPVKNGTELILNLMVFISITIFLDKIDIIQSIKSCITIMLLEFICEGINVLAIQFILRKDVNEILKNRMLKILYSSPSLVVFGCIAIFSYIKLVKGKELEYR